MDKGNVLVIGNSGVGKSTLINAVLGEHVAKTGWGTKGITGRLEIYESQNETVPFRLIDSIGFVPNYFKARQAINAVKKWSKEAAKIGNENRQINVIWFCIDGTSRKLFEENIKNFISATSMWKSVPVIVTITKSYSIPDRKDNIAMVRQAFGQKHTRSVNVEGIIPVVAQTYVLNESAFAPPEGIDRLIEETNRLMPEGFKAAEKDLSQFILNRKRALAQSVVTAATTAGVVIGAIPIPFSDAVLLTPTEITEINAIARIYGIKNDENCKMILDSIVEVGTVGVAAKVLIGALKAIPGINLAAGVINAVIAGVIIAGIGEGSIYAFEQIYLGNKTVKDIDWVTKIIEAKLTIKLLDKVKPILAKLNDKSDKKAILQVVLEIIAAVIIPDKDAEAEAE